MSSAPVASSPSVLAAVRSVAPIGVIMYRKRLTELIPVDLQMKIYGGLFIAKVTTMSATADLSAAAQLSYTLSSSLNRNSAPVRTFCGDHCAKFGSLTWLYVPYVKIPLDDLHVAAARPASTSELHETHGTFPCRSC